MNQALVIIDAQQELIEGKDGEQRVFNKDGLLNNINAVIEKASEMGHLVVFVRDLDVAEGKGEGFEIHQSIKVPVDAIVFDKKATNSFYATPLLEALKAKQVGHLIIMGCKTEHCIDTAVRAATVKGFDVTLVEDGHSTTDNAIISAEQIIKHHNRILHGHYNVDHFSMVRKTEDDLFQPPHDNYR
ncbi:Nicotinamidase-related amidase [Paenibacillus sophorae]|uniref:Cysteine hydrolase n=1 Tax=Paenibacillus sophorae TaxID=1333845 RepID=A0A1H8FTA2_9BACL|nr:cysteine hydrolase family protein [Paenibacillus sophorae]QWU13970.1 cysteine hydrolase [Paenibacillus sophorae]SEN34775.1 Nicotinamidase-related amidase [Paenibacillus sophorae]